MLYTKIVEFRGKQYIRTYSDTHMVERDGIQYIEAIDPVDSERTYTESNTPLEFDMTEVEQKAAAYDILTGVSE